MTFQESIRVCFQKYVDFSGVAKRPEFWWFALFCMLGALILEVFSSGLSWLFSLITLLPSLAVGTRRLHDIGKSGWWQLLWLIPIIGWAILIYFLVQPSEQSTASFE